jgi:hypothetical protein
LTFSGFSFFFFCFVEVPSPRLPRLCLPFYNRRFFLLVLVFLTIIYDILTM